jgi:hypothetical protein
MSRRNRLYLDTSAYLCMLLAQKGGQQLSDETAKGILLSSVLLLVEARRSLVRLARERVITAAHYQGLLNRVEEDAGLLVLRDVTVDLCELSPLPSVLTPRSLDLVHLRTALWFHGEEKIDRFVTTDLAQQGAAKELGLPV